jgi:hypothetical protein
VSDNSEVCEYLIHPALKPKLDAWLLTQGIEVHRAPFLDSDEPDALPVYLLTPTDELMRRFK